MSDSQTIYKPTVSAMLPTAGLFLPETLHRREGPAPVHTETDSTRLKYFQRKTGRPKNEAREAEKSMVSIPDLGSPEDLEAFPSISTAFQFAQFVSSSSKPSSESHALAILLHRVRQDVSEAHRLYLSAAVLNFLEAWPDRKSWIDSILSDIRHALNDIGQYIETFRVAGEDGGPTGLKRRFEWISGHQKRLSTKQQLLSTCHSSLVTAINIMQTVELCGVSTGSWQDPIYEAPVQPWVKSDDANALRGPYSRREWRLSQKNLSASNIHLPESEQDNTETRSVNSIPAELPGSTPDDLAGCVRMGPAATQQTCNSNRHSSQRQTYSDQSSDAIEGQARVNGSPVYDYSSLPASLRIQSPIDHTRMRNSFDQSPSTALTLPDASRNSLDSSRPNSHPGRFRGITLAGTSPRTLSDIVAPLPTLSEKTVERNDSTTSTTNVITVPLVARRYHANHVYIRRQPDRHHSLPSELPHLQSQSLLTEDLANWMTPASTQSEKLKSTEWGSASGRASPSTSVASCPVIAQVQSSEPKVDTSFPENNDEEDNIENSRPPNHNEEPSSSRVDGKKKQIRDNEDLVLEQIHIGGGDRNYAASVRSHSSSITRKPVPVTAKIHSSVIIPTTAADKESKSPNKEDLTVSTASYPQSVPRPLLSSTTSSVDDVELSLLQQRMLSQNYVDSGSSSRTEVQKEVVVALPPPKPTASEPELLSPSLQDKEVVPEAPTPSVPVKPMSAQAKRRAAHQRRMELAFGS